MAFRPPCAWSTPTIGVPAPRGDGAIAFDRPARLAPQQGLDGPRAFPLAALPIEVDGAAPAAGVVEDLALLDAAGLWVIPNNAPDPNALTLRQETATLEFALEQLLTSCASDSPPCETTPPDVTGALLAKGHFNDDTLADLAIYVQGAPATTGAGILLDGDLIYLEALATGGFQLSRRHGVGGTAVDMMVEDFDLDGLDDTALLFPEQVLVLPSCGGACLRADLSLAPDFDACPATARARALPSRRVTKESRQAAKPPRSHQGIRCD